MSKLVDAKDFDRLVLCMQLTTSDNDNEALAAVRRANSILARHELRWDEWLPKLRQPNGGAQNSGYRQFNDAPPPRSGLDHEAMNWIRTLGVRAAHSQAVNEKSKHFVLQILNRLNLYGASTRISEKQWSWLESIDGILASEGL